MKTVPANELTVEEVIGLCVTDLKQINIPMEHIEDIGLPVSQVLHNLEICHKAIISSMKKTESEKPNEEIPKLQEIGGTEDAEENQLEGAIQE